MEIYWNVFIPSEVLRIDFQLAGDEKKVCETYFVCIWISPHWSLLEKREIFYNNFT